MKKALSLILSALMVAGFATASMAAPLEKGVDYVVIEEADPDNYCPEALVNLIRVPLTGTGLKLPPVSSSRAP